MNDPVYRLIFLALYLGTLAVLLGFGVHRVKLLWMYARARRQPAPVAGPWPLPGAEPKVCVQCPVFNEALVIEHLLASVARLDWPAEKLEIQILDDSTDETTELIARWLAAHPELTSRVKHLHRRDRSGYKAGALAAGMTVTDAEYLAVLDADFRPEPDFLRKLVPHLADPQVGVVQARWEFINRHASLLTRFQAVFLDAHFVVEQTARHGAGLFFNFNGTAGIWRRSALVDAGGWCADTVTEDLDASYRAQMRGWRFVYLLDYVVPSELPENLTAFKSQQRRWTKGGVQVARKLLRRVASSALPARVKREAFAHLLVGFVHPFLVLFTVLLMPYLVLTAQHPQTGWWWMIFNPLTVIITGGGAVAFYVTGQFFREGRWREALLWMVASPFVLAFGLAMSITGAVAACEGLFSDGGEFVRTPKGGRAARAGSLVTRLSSRSLYALISVAEVTFGALLLGTAIYFADRGAFYVAWILGVKAVGFFALAAWSAPDLWPRVARA